MGLSPVRRRRLAAGRFPRCGGRAGPDGCRVSEVC